jgi:methylmalonyl-CoA/ethylmalonyl-CoA epimerase
MSDQNQPTAARPAAEPAHLKEIGQIALTVRDLAKAKDFYGRVLGLEFLFDAGNMIFFKCGNVRLLIGAAANAEPSEGTIIYFRTADIHATHGALKEQGVRILQAPHVVAKMKEHDLWLAFLKDPEGNTLALMSEVGHG